MCPSSDPSHRSIRRVLVCLCVCARFETAAEPRITVVSQICVFVWLGRQRSRTLLNLSEPFVNPEPARTLREEAELLSIWTMTQFEARFDTESIRALSSKDSTQARLQIMREMHEKRLHRPDSFALDARRSQIPRWKHTGSVHCNDCNEGWIRGQTPACH